LDKMLRLRAEFAKFVFLGERVDAVLAEQGSRRARLIISVDGSPRAKVSIECGEEVVDCPGWLADVLAPVFASSSALDQKLNDLAGRTGRLSFQMTPEYAASCFPCATKWLGARRIAALAATSHLVGMVCPGLHSIYGALSVAACSDSSDEDGLAFRVSDMDPRFRSLEQEIVGGGLVGTISAFARTPPVEQASIESLVRVVDPTEFSGSVALIVGGSRGLGELTAKLIAAGGGNVLITWQSGKEDAERVAQEIRAFGGRCETFRYDARMPAAGQLAAMTVIPTHVYYFATPAIFRPPSGILSLERLSEFMAVYVDGFWQLVRTLQGIQPSLSVYYPSSSAVSERPRGMTEYAMAKAAGEVLCADINTLLFPLRIYVSRLPRLPTDQTATVTPVETANPVDTMINIVRNVQSWPEKRQVPASHLLDALSVAR